MTATAGLVDALEATLADAGFETPRGRTLTTSAVYRETVAEIERYRDEGVVSLDMETAALWAACRYRGVDTATVHRIGDYLTPDGWTPDAVAERDLPAMLDPTVEALETYAAGR